MEPNPRGHGLQFGFAPQAAGSVKPIHEYILEWVLLVLQSVKVRQEHNQWPVAATSSPNAGPPPVDIINLWGLTQGRHISVTLSYITPIRCARNLRLTPHIEFNI